MAPLAAMASLVSAVLQLGFVSAADNAGTDKKTIQVFAAASTTNAIREIKRQFTAATGVELRASFGSSATLARQIANGAEADVFLSADVKWADDLAQKGLVARKRNLLGNRLVIVVPDDSKLSVTKAEDLAASQIVHIAMGEPKSVPAGKYARIALEKLGLWEKVKSKVAAADDVRNALTYVETGAAEAGIVYATDAAISRKVRAAAEIPESLTGPVRYPVVLLKREKDAAAAESFYKFLSSPESLKVFRKYGFSILND
jgi:molybdate transport system substrate-binding protein